MDLVELEVRRAREAEKVIPKNKARQPVGEKKFREHPKQI